MNLQKCCSVNKLDTLCKGYGHACKKPGAKILAPGFLPVQSDVFLLYFQFLYLFHAGKNLVNYALRTFFPLRKSTKYTFAELITLYFAK